MAEVVISIPEELKEDLMEVSGTDWSLAVNRLVRKELAKLLEIRSVVSKSKLTEADVRELSDKVDKALAERFLKSLK